MPDKVCCAVARVEQPTGCRWPLLGLVATAAALGLAALSAVLFLNAREPQTAAVLPDDPGPLNALVEPAKQLFETFVIANFDTHNRYHHLYVRAWETGALTRPKGSKNNDVRRRVHHKYTALTHVTARPRSLWQTRLNPVR